MTLVGLHDRETAIDALLLVARREMLLLAIALDAIDDDATAVASARLRWSIGSARHLLALGREAVTERHASELDRIANRAQRWLVSEPPLPLNAIRGLVDRIAARPGRRGPGIVADHVNLVDLDLDDLELHRLRLHGAIVADVTARRAGCDAADARASRWQRCQLDGASFAMAVFSGSALEDCTLERANLPGTSWHRATLARCDLARATLVDARLDRAVFTDCNLRGANLAIAGSPELATLAGAQFVRCDLRDTDWTGRELTGVTFADCTLFGARGISRLAG